MRRIISLLSIAAAAFCAAIVPQAQAQTYPDRPIRFVVPYTPGGQFDIHARMLADLMTKSLGQQVIIENKPGAGTMVGAEYVAQQKPDGYTILFAGANMLSINPHLYPAIRYKVSDFQTITLINSLPMGLMINIDKIPAKDFKEFVAYVKANPGKVSFGTSGTGGVQHLTGELTKMRLGLEMTQVAYRGTPEVIADLNAGEVQVAFDGMAAYLPQTGPGKKIRILAVASDARVPAVPDVPTYPELGYPDIKLATYGGVITTAGTPRPIVDKLRDAIIKANSDPEIEKRIIQGAAIPRTSTPEEFDRLIQADSVIWGEVIRKLNLKVN